MNSCMACAGRVSKAAFLQELCVKSAPFYPRCFLEDTFAGPLERYNPELVVELVSVVAARQICDIVTSRGH